MATSLRLLPKQVPTDKWSLKEKLALACSVMRSGDNNWVSVSRAIRTYGDSGRPTDWFSQKNCALQYSDLLEKAETPKRKRGDREVSETPGDVIVRKLTIERIEELKRIVLDEEQRYKKLKQEVELLQTGQGDGQLDEFEAELETDRLAEEAKAKKWEEELEAREIAKQKRMLQGLRIKVDPEEKVQGSPMESTSTEEDSNQSGPSASTPLSTTSQDIKASPSVIPKPPLISQPKEEPEASSQSEAKGAEPEQGASQSDVSKVEPKEEPLIPESEIKTEQLEPEVKLEPDMGAEDLMGGGDSFQLLDAHLGVEETTVTAEPSDDEVSAVDQADIPAPDPGPLPDVGDGDKEIFVPVLEEKLEGPEDVDAPDSASEVCEAPLSPASSVMSNDTDASCLSMRGKGRRNSRGGKTKRGRRSQRSTRSRLVDEDKAKESEASSKAESSDDDCGDLAQPESDDTASNATGRHHQSFSESVPNSPASIAPGDTEDEKAHKVWKKSIMLVWRSAAIHKYANVFSHPVTEEIAPGYHSVVHRPLDLATIKKAIENNSVRTTSDFQRDMMLMFTNAIMYNNSDHNVFHMATEMYDDVMTSLEQYVSTQLIVHGGEPKLLRTTARRSEVHSDKEEETKRKRTPSEQEGGKTKKRKT